jgi:eukaryotic-like serine/threonine-protein kinase
MTEKASWNFEPDTPIAEGRWVLKSLGGGNRFEVFLVWDEKLFSPVVAKVLRPDRVEDERALRALRREAELLERLAHPVLVRGFGAVLDGRCPHVLVEDVDGPTLRRLIRRHGSLPLEQLLPLALHVASALHYLSTERVVHFDVKPGNIVMAVPPRLIDLSLARSFDDAPRIAKPVGTSSYMAPEVCAAPGSGEQIGPSADVWSFGATLYEAITGEPSFARNGETERYPQLVADPRPLGKQVPAGLASLVMRMLAKDPAERPPAREVATVLEAFTA